MAAKTSWLVRNSISANTRSSRRWCWQRHCNKHASASLPATPAGAQCLRTSGNETCRSFPADQPPARLSEWGILAVRGDQLVLHSDVVPYELNTPLFSDYALEIAHCLAARRAQRQATTRIRSSTFRLGTIISKTFHYRKADDWRQDKANVAHTLQDNADTSVPPLNLDDPAAAGNSIVGALCRWLAGIPLCMEHGAVRSDTGNCRRHPPAHAEGKVASLCKSTMWFPT